MPPCQQGADEGVMEGPAMPRRGAFSKAFAARKENVRIDLDEDSDEPMLMPERPVSRSHAAEPAPVEERPLEAGARWASDRGFVTAPQAVRVAPWLRFDLNPLQKGMVVTFSYPRGSRAGQRRTVVFHGWQRHQKGEDRYHVMSCWDRGVLRCASYNPEDMQDVVIEKEFATPGFVAAMGA